MVTERSCDRLIEAVAWVLERISDGPLGNVRGVPYRRLRDAEALGSQADAHRRERARQPDLGPFGPCSPQPIATDQTALGRVFRLPHGDCPSLAVTEVGPVRVITGGHKKLAFLDAAGRVQRPPRDLDGARPR